MVIDSGYYGFEPNFDWLQINKMIIKLSFTCKVACQQRVFNYHNEHFSDKLIVFENYSQHSNYLQHLQVRLGKYFRSEFDWRARVAYIGFWLKNYSFKSFQYRDIDVYFCAVLENHPVVSFRGATTEPNADIVQIQATVDALWSQDRKHISKVLCRSNPS